MFNNFDNKPKYDVFGFPSDDKQGGCQVCQGRGGIFLPPPVSNKAYGEWIACPRCKLGWWK